MLFFLNLRRSCHQNMFMTNQQKYQHQVHRKNDGFQELVLLKVRLTLSTIVINDPKNCFICCKEQKN